jgi:hypothetical protein
LAHQSRKQPSETMPAVTEQEKSNKNMDKSGLYDIKRNIIAHEGDYCPKVDIKLLRVMNTVAWENR